MIHGNKEGKRIYKFKERWIVSQKLYVRADNVEEAEALREKVDNSMLDDDEFNGEPPEFESEEIVIIQEIGYGGKPDIEIPVGEG